MDNHATSSMPFIDDDVTRNRTYEWQCWYL
jgi:hypothetical protein